jgi:hypothetical protein
MLRFAPRAVLFDYGDTLVEELGFDAGAGMEWLLSKASHRPEDLTADDAAPWGRQQT